jgi:hypothetical protein
MAHSKTRRFWQDSRSVSRIVVGVDLWFAVVLTRYMLYWLKFSEFGSLYKFSEQRLQLHAEKSVTVSTAFAWSIQDRESRGGGGGGPILSIFRNIYIESNCRTTDEWWIEKRMEGIYREVIEATSRCFLEALRKIAKGLCHNQYLGLD